MKIIVLFAGLLLLVGGLEECSAAEEVRLMIAPKSATLTPKGRIEFDAFIFNGTKKKAEVPWLQRAYHVVWRLHDICKVRPDRDETSFVIGTDAVETVTLDPGTAKGCVLGAQFDSEPGDVLEFYITIERKLKSDAVQTIRSNSILMYRPKEESATGQGAKIDKPAAASSPKAAITPKGKS